MTNRTFEAGSFASPSYYYEKHTASGANGKFEVINGISRVKWNNYSRYDYVHRKTIKPGFEMNCGQPYNDWPTDLDLACQNKLIHKIKGHQFQLGVALAEGKQTYSMVRDNLSTLGHFALDVRHGRFSSALRRVGTQYDVNSRFFGRGRTWPGHSRVIDGRKLTTKDIAGRWLELQFGWLPLVDDVFEAHKAYHALTMGPRIDDIKAVLYKKSLVDYSNSPTLYSVYCDVVKRVIYRYELREDLPAPRSLGLTDPASIVWEIVPYSFLVDYFIPIGTFLENMNMAPKLTGRSIKTMTIKMSGQSHYKDKRFKDSHLDVAMYQLQRTVGTGLQGTVLPSFKSLPDAMSAKHIWNSLALLRQRMS